MQARLEGRTTAALIRFSIISRESSCGGRDAALRRGSPVDDNEDQLYHAAMECDLGLVTSGTVVTELALSGLPVIVAYKASFLTSLAARLLAKVPYVSVLNLVGLAFVGAGQSVPRPTEAALPEFLFGDCTGQGIASKALEILQDQKQDQTQEQGNMAFDTAPFLMPLSSVSVDERGVARQPLPQAGGPTCAFSLPSEIAANVVYRYLGK
jgi:lipid A disaccharide synthetase